MCASASAFAHDAAQAPHAPGTVGIGATVMAFPLAEPGHSDE